MLFRQHIQCVQSSGYEIVSDIDKDYLQLKIQLDDGFAGVYQILDFLKEKKLPIEIFIITSKIGKEGYLNEDQIKEMNSSKLVRFSSHTHSHSDLSKCDSKSLINELQTSKKILEKLTTNQVNALCYPKGLFSEKVIQAAKDLDYKEQYSSLPGSYKLHEFKHVYKRNLVQFSDLQELKCILDGAMSIFNKKYWRRHFSK